MDQLISISVIIPVYNTEKYISRCLNSIINNNYQNLEIICINDGSTDNSLSVLRKYQKKDHRISIIDVPNGGVSNARNLGLDKATGNYICFIDSDDWIHKDFFNILVNYAAKYESDITACGFCRTNNLSVTDTDVEEDLSVSVFEKNIGLDNHTIKSFIWGRLYKYEVMQNHRFEERVKISEDTLYNIEIIADKPNIKTALIDAELYYYYDRADSAINTSHGLDFKVLSYIYLDRAEQTDDKYVSGIYLNDAFKNTFTVRYLTRKATDPELKSELNGLIKRCLLVESTKKPLPLKIAIIYKLMSYFPIVYALFRRVKER